MKFVRRSLVAVLLAGAAAGIVTKEAAAQAPYPNRPVTLVVPYPAGGSARR